MLKKKVVKLIGVNEALRMRLRSSQRVYLKGDDYVEAYNRVLLYIRKCIRYQNKHKKRPFKVEYGHIGVACGITYGQVRRIVRDLELLSEVETWISWNEQEGKMVKYFRLK